MSSEKRRVEQILSHLSWSSCRIKEEEKEGDFEKKNRVGIEKLDTNGSRRRIKKGRRSFTRDEIEGKREEGLCWVVIHGNVYDVTDFLEEHPGGSEMITDLEWDDFETFDEEFDDRQRAFVVTDQ